MWRALGDEQALAQAWRSAEPFPYLVIDDFVEPDAVSSLLAILDDESVDRYESDLFVFDASPVHPRPELGALRDAFTRSLADPLSRITGKTVRRADMRAYAYRPGHYLLPHADHQDGLERLLAFAYYVPSPEPPAGGELELFACARAGGQIVATTSARIIEPRANRLVVFDVGELTLHQVREVLGGVRLSLAGWFYP